MAGTQLLSHPNGIQQKGGIRSEPKLRDGGHRPLHVRLPFLFPEVFQEDHGLEPSEA